MEGSYIIVKKNTCNAISFQGGISGIISIIFYGDTLEDYVLITIKKSKPVEILGDKHMK